MMAKRKKPNVITLDSGLRVVLIPQAGVESLTVMAMVGVGSRYEDKQFNGISHFVEHMVFKGTEKWSEARDLSEAVDSVGADFNAFTGKEYTGFYVRGASRHLEFFLDVISDMLYTPKLRPSDIEREKGVIVEEINMYNDLPQRKVGDLFDQAMYGDVGLGRRIDGTPKVVRSFEKKDFVNHMKSWYGRDNTCLAVVGDASVLKDEDKVLAKVKKFFAKGEDYGKTTVERIQGWEDHDRVQSVVHTKQSDQAHMVLGFPGYSLHHSDRYILSVLQIILGGNMSSRLFSEVREKRGLAYYARVDVDRFADTGAIAAAEGVDVSRVDEAVEVTMKVFSDVDLDGKGGITQKELVKAQEYLAGSLLLSMESTRNTAQYWAQRVVLNDELIGPDEVLERVRAVKRDEVARVAEEVIRPEKMVFALVGPFDDGGKFERLLKFKAN